MICPLAIQIIGGMGVDDYVLMVCSLIVDRESDTYFIHVLDSL